MQDIENAFRMAKDGLDPVMRTGSYTLGFAVDLAMAAAGRQLNIFRIVDELAAMEGTAHRGSMTKPAQMFTRRHLRGYWHKHHSQPCYMPINLLNEMHRDKTVEKVLTPHIGEPLTRELFDRLGSALVMENYMRRLREARLTGNWIVFSKRNGANKYLTLADHNEGDAIIAERINRYQAFDLQSGWRSDEPLALERPLLSAQNATVSG